MRTVLMFTALACLVAACETAPSRATADYEIRMGLDPETGYRFASSAQNQDVERSRAYSNMTHQMLVMWVEAVQTGEDQIDVFIVGQRLRHRPEESTDITGRYERRNVAAPAYVGRPLREADLQLRWTEISCRSGGFYFCNQVDMMEIELTPEMVTTFLASDEDSLPVAISRRTKIDWRIPRSELIAVLNKFDTSATLYSKTG